MADTVDSSLTTDTTATTDTTDQSSKQAGTEPNAQQTSGQTTAQTTVKPVYDPAWWKKDDRFTKRELWKAEPDIVKSYWELEPQYNKVKGEYGALQKQNEEIVKTFKEFGVEPTSEQIKNVLTELNTFKDPNNLINKRNSFLGHWLDDPANYNRYGEKLDKFFTELSEQELLDNHPGLTKEAAMKQAALESKLSELENFQKQTKLKEDTAMAGKQIDQGIARAKQYADKVGMPWTDDIKNKVIDSCLKDNIPVSLLFERFIALYGEELEKSLTNKVSQEQLKSLNKNKGAVIPGAGGIKPADTTAKTSFRDAAKKALGFGQT